MNNNRGNNRRRGRGNNRGQGGGQQLNRIDSRARGNAPQLLEKYRKMAEDAQRNGDRVTAEYYLQHADHYFRVLADSRARQEEQRAPRQDRWQDGERQDGGEEGDFANEGEYPTFDQPSGQAPQREERGDGRYNQRGEGENRFTRREEPEAESTAPAESLDDNPSDNPFVRDNRQARQRGGSGEGERDGRRGGGGLRPRRSAEQRADDAEAHGLDPATLPPAIGGGPDAEVAPKRRAPRRPKPPADDALAAVES